MALPIPRPAPVIRATLPSNLIAAPSEFGVGRTVECSLWGMQSFLRFGLVLVNEGHLILPGAIPTEIAHGNKERPTNRRP